MFRKLATEASKNYTAYDKNHIRKIKPLFSKDTESIDISKSDLQEISPKEFSRREVISQNSQTFGAENNSLSITGIRSCARDDDEPDDDFIQKQRSNLTHIDTSNKLGLPIFEMDESEASLDADGSSSPENALTVRQGMERKSQSAAPFGFIKRKSTSKNKVMKLGSLARSTKSK